MAEERVAYQGLPARICWLGYGERHRAGLKFNEWSRPASCPPDRHRPRPPGLRLGRVTVPGDRGHGRRLGCHRGLAAAERVGEHGVRRFVGVSIHHGGGVGMGRSIPGSGLRRRRNGLAAQKLERVLINDPGMGVIRHADAGYEHAIAVAADRGVRIPMQDNT